MNGIKPALITPGDPSGIGPEIALKAWSEGQKNIVLMGDIEHLSSVALAAGLNISFTTFDSTVSLSAEKCSVWKINWEVMPCVGQPDPRNAPTIVESIKQAVKQVKQGQFSSIVTSPIAKSLLYENGFEFPGQTEFLAINVNLKSSSVTTTSASLSYITTRSLIMDT